MQGRSAITLLGAAALAVLACGGSEPTDLDPRPTAVEPGRGHAGSQTLVTIQGDGFLARTTQPSSGGAPTVDVQHRAWLADVELTDVIRVDAHTLRATVPPGVPAGAQALEVENPFGRRGRLDAAFVVDASPPELTAVLRGPGSGALGADFDVTMTVTNSGGIGASDVAPTALTLTGNATATLKSGPTPTAAAVPGGGGAVVFTWTYTAGARAGTVQFSGGAIGTDPSTGTDVTAPPAASGAVTMGKAALGATIGASPAVVGTGQAITLTLTVTNSGSAPVTGIVPGAPIVTRTGGSAASLISGPVPASISSLDPGQSGTFTWTYDPAAGGQLSFTASASGRDGFSNATVTGTSPAAASVTVQRLPALTAVLAAPSTAAVKKDFGVTMMVTNSGDGGATAVAPTPLALTGSATAKLKSGPTPATAAMAGGGSKVTYTWTYTAGGSAGTVQFSGGASGKDASTGATVTAPSVTSGVVTLK